MVGFHRNVLRVRIFLQLRQRYQPIQLKPISIKVAPIHQVQKMTMQVNHKGKLNPQLEIPCAAVVIIHVVLAVSVGDRRTHKKGFNLILLLFE